jgi:hypothetical protein
MAKEIESPPKRRKLSRDLETPRREIAREIRENLPIPRTKKILPTIIRSPPIPPRKTPDRNPLSEIPLEITQKRSPHRNNMNKPIQNNHQRKIAKPNKNKKHRDKDKKHIARKQKQKPKSKTKKTNP